MFEKNYSGNRLLDSKALSKLRLHLPLVEDNVHFVGATGNVNYMITIVIWVQNHQVHSAYGEAIILLNNALVEVLLEHIMPVASVGHMLKAIDASSVITVVKAHLATLVNERLATFPVI